MLVVSSLRKLDACMSMSFEEDARWIMMRATVSSQSGNLLMTGVTTKQQI
jgi:hypothetical protein